ncbi:LysR family transcriptional regulator [Nocardia asteroides]|uniref:LysR family transcriptional regulator n=1 Tax=Nocardia asteroides TaxID=1824 RepID=UPI001E31640E|nr:LysR substrate-binding domain-containing protein [Nocardia asteroides]UGT63693.1 LysR substrate-binding domain-containing protein [Nocardia asteroides]
MSSPDSIDPERLRQFVAVADELHFARAARALGIARQRLSRTVIELEQELGERLFVPGAQPTELTEAGAALREQARAVLAHTARPVAEPEAASLRVGFAPGVTVSKWERIWAERFPEAPLTTVPLAQAEQERALRAGEVDMCFVRLPVERDGLSVISLYRELAVAVVPKEHPVAAYDEIAEADLAGWQRHDGDDIDGAAGILELVAAGVGVAVLPHSIARLHARRDLVYRTVTDLPGTEVALAWPSAATTEPVEEFVGVVRGRTARSTRSPSARAEPAKPARTPSARVEPAKSNRAQPKKAAAKRGAPRASAPKQGRRRGR